MPDQYWLDKAQRVHFLPWSAFNIVNWTGKHVNVKRDLMDLYRHLADCPYAHSIPKLRQGIAPCPWGSKTMEEALTPE